MTKTTHKIGDYVQSSDASLDVRVQARRYRGTVAKVRRFPRGWAYTIHGRWEGSDRDLITERLLFEESLKPWTEGTP